MMNELEVTDRSRNDDLPIRNFATTTRASGQVTEHPSNQGRIDKETRQMTH